jgi:DNA polymerase III subunit epsilon
MRTFNQGDNTLVWIDLETTGVDISTDKIVQVAAIRVKPNGKIAKKTWLVNPGIPIPAEATAIHGITDEMVKDQPTFDRIAQTVASAIGEHVICGYNIDRFDLPLLRREMYDGGVRFHKDHETVTLDVMKLVGKLFSRKLGAMYERYVGEELVDSHDAYEDAKATMILLGEMIKQEEGVPQDLKGIKEFYYDEKRDKNNHYDSVGKLIKDDQGRICFNFGAHKGKPVDTEPSYAKWMIGKAKDFPADTIEIVKTEIKW